MTVKHFALPLSFLLIKWKKAYKKYVNWPGWCPIIDNMSSNEIITCLIIDLLIKDLWFLGISWADGLFSFVLYHLDPPLKCTLEAFFSLEQHCPWLILFSSWLDQIYHHGCSFSCCITAYGHKVLPDSWQLSVRKGLVILYNFLFELCALNDHEAARYIIFVLSTMF